MVFAVVVIIIIIISVAAGVSITKVGTGCVTLFAPRCMAVAVIVHYILSVECSSLAGDTRRDLFSKNFCVSPLTLSNRVILLLHYLSSVSISTLI